MPRLPGAGTLGPWLQSTNRDPLCTGELAKYASLDTIVGVAERPAFSVRRRAQLGYADCRCDGPAPGATGCLSASAVAGLPLRVYRGQANGELQASSAETRLSSTRGNTG